MSKITSLASLILSKFSNKVIPLKQPASADKLPGAQEDPLEMNMQQIKQHKNADWYGQAKVSGAVFPSVQDCLCGLNRIGSTYNGLLQERLKLLKDAQHANNIESDNADPIDEQATYRLKEIDRMIQEKIDHCVTELGKNHLENATSECYHCVVDFKSGYQVGREAYYRSNLNKIINH